MLALGSLHGLSFAIPATLSGVAGLSQIAIFALFWSQLRATGPMRAGLLALAFGMANFIVGVGWVYISMTSFGGMPGVLAAMALVLLSFYLGIWGAGAIALAKTLLSRYQSTAGAAQTACIVAACWGVGEIARGFALTGFPWLSVGYAHLDTPWQDLAAITGVYGLGMFACLVAVWLAGLWRAPGQHLTTPRTRLHSGLGLFAVVLVASAASLANWTTPTGAPLSVRLAQGNVPQSMKFDRARSAQAVTDYLTMISDSKAALTVLPEIAFVRPLDTLPAETRIAIGTALKASAGAVAIGVPAFSTDEQARQQRRIRLTNSIVTFSPDGEALNRYDKRHLVPFGEYIPFGFAWFVNMMNIPLGEFGRGGPAQPALQLDGRLFAFNICYEDLFGEELADHVRRGANVLINISNIAWFGHSHALPQHLAISRMRSVELARPMLRSTNTGVTASIDHHGKVLGQLPVYQQGVLDISVQPVTGMTPFARVGMLAPLLLIGLLLLVGVIRRR